MGGGKRATWKGARRRRGVRLLQCISGEDDQKQQIGSSQNLRAIPIAGGGGTRGGTGKKGKGGLKGKKA